MNAGRTLLKPISQGEVCRMAESGVGLTHSPCLFYAPILEQPPWTVRHQWHTRSKDHRCANLDNEWCAPGEGGFDGEGKVADEVTNCDADGDYSNNKVNGS